MSAELSGGLSGKSASFALPSFWKPLSSLCTEPPTFQNRSQGAHLMLQLFDPDGTDSPLLLLHVIKLDPPGLPKTLFADQGH